jgi:galactose mutarotase-like enzyme
MDQMPKGQQCGDPPVAEPAAFTAALLEQAVGGCRAVRLTRTVDGEDAQPRIVSADVLPGRGMHVYQLRASLPGAGVVDLLESPPITAAGEVLHGGRGDEHGNQSFWVGGAVLAPFTQRIRGSLQPDGALAAGMLGKTVRLPANWKGKKPDSERTAIHGLILATPMDRVQLESAADQASVTGILAGTDFQGHWPSKTHLTIAADLRRDSFGLSMTARNVGGEDLPMGLGWHPYFVFPSGDRAQAKLHIPASQRVLLDDYEDAFPNGGLADVAGTPYDFSAPGGQALGEQYLEDCYVNLHRDPGGKTVAEIIDPAAGFGLRITTLSPEISAYQVYAPPDKSYVALEPLFNWPDPFSRIWAGRDTGMVILRPDQAVQYSVRVQVFHPFLKTESGVAP